MKVKIEVGAHVGQDNSYWSWTEKLKDVVFDAHPFAEGRYRCTAHGYGGEPGTSGYGNGAVYVKVEDVVEIPEPEDVLDRPFVTTSRKRTGPYEKVVTEYTYEEVKEIWKGDDHCLIMQILQRLDEARAALKEEREMLDWFSSGIADIYTVGIANKQPELVGREFLGYFSGHEDEREEIEIFNEAFRPAIKQAMEALRKSGNELK